MILDSLIKFLRSIIFKKFVKYIGLIIKAEVGKKAKLK